MMILSTPTPQTTSAVAGSPTAPKQDEPLLPLDLLELDLLLDGYEGGAEGFSETVRQAAQVAGGEFLFDLPAPSLIDDCARLAVLRLQKADAQPHLVFAVLGAKNDDIRLQAPDERTSHLVQFAHAFVDVLKNIKG